MTTDSGERQPDVTLLGLGVVGRAILDCHLHAGIGVGILDGDDSVFDLVGQQIQKRWPDWELIRHAGPEADLYAGRVDRRDAAVAQSNVPTMLIESVAERLDVKRALFVRAESWYPASTLFCTNTSTLPIHQIAAPLKAPERLIGMHFFMPVDQRDGVEVIASAQTAGSASQRCLDHAKRLGKSPFLVGDGPGFVVNRMLAPYINIAIQLLCQGATAQQIEDAAKSFGMPLSPLELVDLIGTRTAYDGGGTYWQAFPKRMKPSPLLPALVKKKLHGQHGGVGFYRYHEGHRSSDLSIESKQLVDRYRRDVVGRSTAEIESCLAVSMWIEAACLLRDGIVDDTQTIDVAMAGGLGYGTQEVAAGRSQIRFSDYFERLGGDRIQEICRQSSALLRPPEWLMLREESG